MSNESENRIDLTQFRLVTIGIELGLTQAALREWHTGMKRERLGEVIRAHEEVPKLIAELKKMYEMQDEAVEYVSYLTSTPDVLTRFKDMPAQAMTINNLRHSLEGLLTRLGADPQSGFGSNAEQASE